MSEQQEQSLRQRALELVGEAIERVNPRTTEHVASEAYKQVLPASLRKQLERHPVAKFGLIEGLKSLLHEREHMARASMRGTVRSGHNNGSARHSNPEKTILVMSFSIAGDWKRFGDLVPSELRWLVTDRYQKSDEMQEEGKRLHAVLDAMEAEGAETVGDLGADRVLGLYGDAVNV